MQTIDYAIVKSNEIEFKKAICQLVDGLAGRNCVRLCLFIDARSNGDYIEKKSVIQSVISAEFGLSAPTWSVIAQKPLDCCVVLEVQSAKNCTVVHKPGYITLESAYAKEILISGVCGDVNDSIYDQSHSVFKKIEDIFRCEGVTFSDVVRQWNYIERIVAVESGDQHYQSFNDVRSEHYCNESWGGGYPAATGIGTQFGGVIIDLDVVIAKCGGVRIRKIDNDLQVAAHEYSKGLLIGDLSIKTTPKFERAKSIATQDENRVYISGTAAIVGENSLEGVCFEEQIKATMLNIENLICERTFVLSDIRTPSPMKINMFRVYLKFERDVAEAVEYMSSNYGDVAVSYLLGDVCRDELLVEIEGVAYEDKN